jgi:hypothetical protein
MTITASLKRQPVSNFFVTVACAAFLVGCKGSDPVKEQWESRDSARESGRGAELKVQHYTIEGDSVTSYWRVTPDGSTEVYTDRTEDAFSDQEWNFVVCDDPEPVPEVAC